MQHFVECAGPQKHKGESPMFIHWLFLEVQPLFWTSSTKCDSSMKHDALLDRFGKNTCISRTIHCITQDFHHSASQEIHKRRGQHSTTPLSAQSSYDNENPAHSSRVMELPKVAENSPRVASEKQDGTESENTYNIPTIDTFGHYVWKAITPEASNWGTPKLELKCEGSVLSMEVPAHFR